MSTGNRNESYKSILDTLPKRRLIVYEYIQKHQPVSPQQICDTYQMKFNEVAPRFTELHQCGLIKETGESVNERSKKMNTMYSCASINEAITIRNEMKKSLSEEITALTKDVFNNEDSLSNYSKKMIQKRIKNIVQQMKKIKEHE